MTPETVIDGEPVRPDATVAVAALPVVSWFHVGMAVKLGGAVDPVKLPKMVPANAR